jgi:hypothetical protein
MADLAIPDDGSTEYSTEVADRLAESSILHLNASLLQSREVSGEHAAIREVRCTPRCYARPEKGCEQDGTLRTQWHRRVLTPSHADPAILRPSYSDWQMLRPIVTDMYKLKPARIIVAKIQSEGFYVTYVVNNFPSLQPS